MFSMCPIIPDEIRANHYEDSDHRTRYDAIYSRYFDSAGRSLPPICHETPKRRKTDKDNQ